MFRALFCLKSDPKGGSSGCRITEEGRENIRHRSGGILPPWPAPSSMVAASRTTGTWMSLVPVESQGIRDQC